MRIIDKYPAEKGMDLTATLNAEMVHSAVDFGMISVSTNCDSSTQHFDTGAVENVIDLVMKYNPETMIVIKRTTPFGYIKSIRKK